MISEALRRAADATIAVLLAPRCAACQRLLENATRGVVCAACWDTVRLITPPLCERCGAPLPSWRVISQGRSMCARCRRTPRAIDRGRAIGEYEGVLREIIHALKYGGRRSLAPRLAALMCRHGADVLRDADCVVPVPLHPSRRRARGFNQADDLAAHLGLPVVRCLRRTRPTDPQTDLPAGRRHRNVRGAFACVPGARLRALFVPRGWASAQASRHQPWRRLVGDVFRTNSVEGKCVVLVDDVRTTGATLAACASALRAGGAREVRALTAATVVPRRS